METPFPPPPPLVNAETRSDNDTPIQMKPIPLPADTRSDNDTPIQMKPTPLPLPLQSDGGSSGEPSEPPTTTSVSSKVSAPRSSDGLTLSNDSVDLTNGANARNGEFLLLSSQIADSVSCTDLEDDGTVRAPKKKSAVSFDEFVLTAQPVAESGNVRDLLTRTKSKSFDSIADSQQSIEPTVRTRANTVVPRTSITTLRRSMHQEAFKLSNMQDEAKAKLGVLLCEVVEKMRELDLGYEYSDMRLVVHQNGAWIEDGGTDLEHEIATPRVRVRMEADLKCEVREHCPCICCWDEEDDGLPPFCRDGEDFTTTIGIPCCKCLGKLEDEPPDGDTVAWWKLLNGHHKLTNKNVICWLFGTIGFRIFDRRRKTFMAIAMWSTLLSITFTVYGIAAFSTRPLIVKATYWVWVSVENTTDGTVSKSHMGLNSMLLEVEPCTALKCREENLLYSEAPTWRKRAGSVTEFYEKEFADCRATAANEVFGLVVTCCALGFALLGASNRMRFKADFHIQKAIGLVTDTIGAVSLALALFNFWYTCLQTIPLKKEDLEIVPHLGPGYYGYFVCFWGALMRALFHWVTPTPKEWKSDAHVCDGGCCGGLNQMEIPPEILEVLDNDEDQYVSCKDILYFLGHVPRDIVPAMFINFDETRNRRGEGGRLPNLAIPRIEISVPTFEEFGANFSQARHEAERRFRGTIFGRSSSTGDGSGDDDNDAEAGVGESKESSGETAPPRSPRSPMRNSFSFWGR
jgi:hypothetical protein